MDQQVKNIPIKDLVLWTENPRDPIDENATDQDIVDRALEDTYSKWTLSKLAKEMGDYYDFSELPTVVFHENKPVVYDGNRRIILGKIKKGLVSVDVPHNIQLPDFPDSIPCNVCVKKMALNNVYRKHSDTGSWQPLERDLFLHKLMGKDKSIFLVLNDETGIIDAYPCLNQRFVKEEVFKEEMLEAMGFTVKNGELYSRHSEDQDRTILSNIARKVDQKEITTRKNRGKVIEVLEPSSQAIIETNNNKQPKLTRFQFDQQQQRAATKKRKTRRTLKTQKELFGGKLYLRIGKVSDLYRDIVDLHQFYESKKDTLSRTFPGLLRMALRLLCETAAKDKDRRAKLDNYLKDNFATAKASFTQDVKTTLASQNVTEKSIVQLLHTGAHNYESSNNMEQTIAMSIVIGAIITETHGKDR